MRLLTRTFLLIVAASFTPQLMANEDAAATKNAEEIYTATGVKGGLVVHVGVGDGRLTAALCANKRYVVHGLDADTKCVSAARAHVREVGKYGPVSIDHFAGKRLPYADNLVNLVVVQGERALDVSELMRVLVPNGVAYIEEQEGWKKIVKPRPKGIDEWTHYMHGPDNNAVAKDSVVGPPHHLQWIGGPKWARGHEVLATISAVVTSGGRLFYIADEGPIASVDLPSEWMLSARDAFNGVLLWKRKIERWESRFRPFRSGPPQLPRRLVAVGDTVYVTPGYLTPLEAIDAATGETKKVYKGTEGTEEILVADGKLFLVIGDAEDQDAAEKAARRGQTPPPIDKRIVALQPQTGKVIWKRDDPHTAALFAQTLAISDGRLYFQNTQELFCLDAKTGDLLWRTKRPAALKRPAWSVPTVVVHGDVVISADRAAPKDVEVKDVPPRPSFTVSFAGGNAPTGEMIAFSVHDGKEVWRQAAQEGYNAPVDVLLTDDLLWSGNLVKAKDPGITKALDPETGDVKRERQRDQVYFTPGMSHHRCYRNRATEKFVLLGRSGVELLDVKTGKATANHYVRGACQFGVLPANGMIYVPPHTCACYLKTKLNGFNALAPLRPGEKANEVDSKPKGEQLTKGPAYDAIQDPKSDVKNANDWPTYRGSSARSGVATSPVPAKLNAAWQTEISGDLTAMTVAGGRLYVAREDQHTLHALDADSGEAQWDFTAGGAIDSPPTIEAGRVLFGSHDGHVYCLRASDGALAWRFRAGPEDRRMMVDSTLESCWPVHGSVLVAGGVAYFSAGRSSFLDGGIFLYGLDVATGKVVGQTRISGRDAESGEQPKSAVKGFDMVSGLPDVLSSDGQQLFMRDMCFDKSCARQNTSGRHLFSPTGFLDDSWWHRTYWLYSDSFTSGWGGWHRAGSTFPSGRIMAITEDKIFGFGRSQLPAGNAGQWKKGEYYRLYAAMKAPKKQEPQKPTGNKRRRPPVRSQVDYLWQTKIEPEARALILAGETLFVAGPHGATHEDPEAFRGAKGISLQAISTADGKPLAKYPLKSLPVFDGLAAARGKLYLATQDGKVTCYAP